MPIKLSNNTEHNKPTMLTEFDVPSDNIVYHGSPIKYEDGFIDSMNGLIFVTPYKSIASIFTCDRNKYKQGASSNVTNVNLNYKEWDILEGEPLKTVHVIVEGDPERETVEFDNIGYIYKIDISNYKDKLQIYDWMNKDKEMFLEVAKIPYSEVEECVTKRIVSGDEKEDEYNMRNEVTDIFDTVFQEEEHLLSEEIPDSIEDDIDESFDDTEESIEDDTSNNVDTNKLTTSPDIDTTDDVVKIDFNVSEIGSDDSQVQNDYNKTDVEELNNLIAAETDAINDYFEAGKNAKIPVLTKLYADIGSEERFHLEQLMYAKSTITGEKYEPRDEKVKAEYEELLNMGMDEETAMTTAVDKLNISGANDVDDGDDSDVEEIQEDIATIESALIQSDMLFALCESASTPIECNNAMNVFIESYVVYQEALENVSAAENKKTIKIKSPIRLLAQGLSSIIKLFIQLAHKVRDYVSKSKIKRARKFAWLKNHGIKGLFQRGISLYFYDDRVGRVMTDDAVRFIQLLFDVTAQIAKRTGIEIKDKDKLKARPKNSIPCANPEDGINKINNFIYNKTKVVITDKNESMLMQEFFGYSDNKLKVAVQREGDDKTYHESNNIYNRLELIATTAADYAEISKSVLTMLEGFEGNINSIYYKNRKIYNVSVKQMQDVCNGYKRLINAISHDLTTIMKLDNSILEQSRLQDRATQPTEFENAGNSEPVVNEDEHVTKKKPGFFDRFQRK